MDNSNSVVLVPGPNAITGHKHQTNYKYKCLVDFKKKIKKIDKIAFEMREIRTQALLKQDSMERHKEEEDEKHHHHHHQ